MLATIKTQRLALRKLGFDVNGNIIYDNHVKYEREWWNEMSIVYRYFK